MCSSATARKLWTASALRRRAPAECCWSAPTTAPSVCGTPRVACSCAHWTVTAKMSSVWRWGVEPSLYRLRFDLSHSFCQEDVWSGSMFWPIFGCKISPLLIRVDHQRRLKTVFFFSCCFEVVNDLVFIGSSDTSVRAHNIHVSSKAESRLTADKQNFKNNKTAGYSKDLKTDGLSVLGFWFVPLSPSFFVFPLCFVDGWVGSDLQGSQSRCHVNSHLGEGDANVQFGSAGPSLWSTGAVVLPQI